MALRRVHPGLGCFLHPKTQFPSLYCDTACSFLDPEFIIFTGDLLFGGPYLLEYSWAWETLRSFSLPIFMVPGNHDGYASGGVDDPRASRQAPRV